MKNLYCLVVLLFLAVPVFSQQSVFTSYSSKTLLKSRSFLQEQENEPHSLFNAKKNTVSLDFIIIFPAAGYSRIIPFHKKAGVIVSVSATPNWGFAVDLSGGFIFGSVKHFIEPTAGYLFNVDNAFIKLGYRFQGDRGLVLKVAPGWSLSGNLLYLTSGIGYAF